MQHEGYPEPDCGSRSLRTICYMGEWKSIFRELCNLCVVGSSLQEFCRLGVERSTLEISVEWELHYAICRFSIT